ncbi:hypothetical protein IB655_08745 [Francisella noatunensis]|uniref:Uncharacterized protein n=1 Tax=Francisella noatunensis TaxID=657445 RepID=A0A9Q2KWJ8_9GAMM|nr:hypothetical protein [Francisella noatunensis]MBK2028422.1 hypothetical protein [Francisella noatunensis]MBK2034092.1 hypothetical protein [Francisella noatunensis]MBK2049169.1 hypothetical protein [Francisella noatunensis]MBK2050789.1 hypothetical protein [Francisella noatunensis]MBK2052289.1 hypothetical protein [Francisella noatunensis]
MDNIVTFFGKKGHNANLLIQFLYQKPIISVADIIEPLNISKQTANLLIRDFEKNNILKEITGYERNKLYAFEKYLNIYSKT